MARVPIRRPKHLWLIMTALVAMVVVACGPAIVQGGGGFSSPTKVGAKGSFSFNASSVCEDGSFSCDAAQMALVNLTGGFKDQGTNKAWPYGVSMSFSGKLMEGSPTAHGFAIGAGDQCEEPDLGITAGSLCWFGLVAYRSTDLKHYPNNTGSQDCSGIPVDWFTATGNNQKTALSGWLFTLIVDSTNNGKPDKGDKIAVAALCGPYGNRTAKSGVLDGATAYSYGSCPADSNAGLTGGVLPADWYVGFNPTQVFVSCLIPITSGNVSVTLITPTPAPAKLEITNGADSYDSVGDRYLYDFGTVLTGTSHTFTITNTGGSTSSSIQLYSQTHFSLANDTCTGSTLAPAATCTFDVVFDDPSVYCTSFCEEDISTNQTTWTLRLDATNAT